MYSFLPYVFLFVLLLFGEGSSVRPLHITDSIKIYQFGGDLYVKEGDPSITFDDTMGITTFLLFVQSYVVCLLCGGMYNKCIYSFYNKITD